MQRGIVLTDPIYDRMITELYTAVAFMTADQNCVKLLTTCQRSVVDKVLETVPQMMQEVKDMLCSQEGKKNAKQQQAKEAFQMPQNN